MPEQEAQSKAQKQALREERKQKAKEYVQTVRDRLIPGREEEWRKFLNILVNFRRSCVADRSAHKDLVEAAHLQVLLLFADDLDLIDGFQWFLCPSEESDEKKEPSVSELALMLIRTLI